MFNSLIDNQKYILIFCGLVCLFLAFFIEVMSFKSIRKKKALIRLELGVAALVLSDAAGYFLDGSPTMFGYWANRFFIFAVYIFVLANTYFIVEYVTYLFMETGKFDKLPARLLLGHMLPTIGVLFVIISQFTGMYYYFDEHNCYQRGPVFAFAMFFPFVAILIVLTFVLQYRKLIGGWLFAPLVIFALAPMVSTVLQLLLPGLNYIDFLSWGAAVVLFLVALMWQNRELALSAFIEIGTGLANADGFQMKVNKVIAEDDITKYTAYYLDISRMSHINNKYGKRIGDEVILLYAQALKEFIEKDEILGRLGGNYFVALLKTKNTEKFLNFIAAVPIEITFEGQQETLYLSAVAGCYKIESKNIVAGQILTNTALALSHAKSVAHKPYVFLDHELEAEFERIRVIETDARIGLQKDEFEPYYQPKVDAKGKVLCGAEALVRWKRNGQIVSPAEFVSVLEKNTGICKLDFYILDRVCRDIKEWLEKGYEPVTVSVNFSRKNLGNPILAEAISNVVEKYGIPKKYIQIEVTETLDEFPMSYLIGVVEAIQRYGMTVAIDDFGTGSSSINLLKVVKFDVLKIDKAFIDYKDEKEKQLLCDIIHMAKNIDIDVVAEGVEDKEHVEELVKMGCHVIQGYVFDKPLQKSDYEKKLIEKTY